jgi:aminoglycoside phosphotransferase (APT) family kinase protein
MQSTTKTDISRALIEAMVRTAFGSDVVLAEVTSLDDGWFNSAYAIRFLHGLGDVVLRVAPDPRARVLTYEQHIMRAEIEVYELVQEKLDVPVPHLLAYNLRRDIVDREYMFTEMLSGTPLNKLPQPLSPEQQEAVERELGAYAARIHALHGPGFGYFGKTLYKSWREAFLDMVLAVLGDGASLSVELPQPYDQIRATFEDLAGVLDEVELPSLVHWDLWPGNVFVVKEDGRYTIEGITDWERAYWGDPESELPMVLRPRGAPWFGGYGRELSEGRAAAVRHCMYRLYLWLVMVIEAKVRFEGADHVRWAYAKLGEDLETLRGYQ